MVQKPTSIQPTLQFQKNEILGVFRPFIQRFLIQERQQTLKCLYLDGESLSDQTFGNLFLCQKLQELGISFAEEMDENGILSISKLNQLKVLKLKRAKNVKADDFVTLFANKNLCKLQNLDLR